MEFEWDPVKAEANLRKHGLSFAEATELLAGDAEYLEIFDDTQAGEDRFTAIGPIRRGMIVVVFTEREDDIVRIISAREATRREVQLFQDHEASRHE
jgi:uncharacterized DUF497 family protein